MQILMLSSQYSPDNKMMENELTWKTAGQFVKQGHDVRMVVPGNVDLTDAQPALALRLTPIQVSLNESQCAYTRFDSKTTAGIELFVLKAKDDNPLAYTPKALGLAADALVSTMDFSPEVIVAWNDEITLEGALLSCPLKIAAYSRLEQPAQENSSPTPAVVADKIIVHGRTLANAIAQNSNTPVATAVRSGKATVVQLSSNAPRQSVVQKESAKASLQTAIGLPIEQKTPLFYLQLPLAKFAQALPEILTQPIQIVCKSNTETDDFKQLAATYPDRLCVLPLDVKEETIINAVDFCIQDNAPQLVAAALCAATVPVVIHQGTPSVVSLDPSMKSGTGLVFEDSPASLIEAIGNATGMYSQTTPFNVLRGRLANTVAPLDAMIEQYITVNPS